MTTFSSNIRLYLPLPHSQSTSQGKNEVHQTETPSVLIIPDKKPRKHIYPISVSFCCNRCCLCSLSKSVLNIALDPDPCHPPHDLAQLAHLQLFWAYPIITEACSNVSLSLKNKEKKKRRPNFNLPLATPVLSTSFCGQAKRLVYFQNLSS